MKALKGNENKMWQVFFVFGLALVLLASWGAPTFALEKGKPKYGGILRWWNRREPATYDPHRYRTAVSYGPSSIIFSNLVRSTMQDPFAVEPGLAQRWEVSADGKVYTFYLYQGVKWHDGKPFTAADVKYSLEKMADPKTGPETNKLLLNFERAEAVDKYTVKVYLSAPQPNFLEFLTIAFCKILPKHVLEKGYDHKSSNWLIGTGPFKLKKHQKKIMWEVERYKDYHHKGLPYLDGVANYFITDREAQVSALIAKRLDMSAPAMAHNAVAELEAIKAGIPDAIFQTFICPNARHVRFGFTNPDAPWQDPRVRKAIDLAMEKSELMLAATGSDKLFTAPGGYLYPFGPFALPEKELASYMGTDKPYEERVAEAKRLMAAAGFSKGFETALTCRGDRPAHRRGAEMVAEQVRRIGIKLNIDAIDTATFWERRGKGDFKWLSDATDSLLGDPDELLVYYLTGNPFNYGRYSNPKVDELYRRSTQLTGAERVKVAQDIARALWADRPVGQMYYYGYAIAMQPYVKDFRNPGALSMNLELVDKVWFDK
ncbi:MAG: ABC transporter substrate-binding protein [Deltaproteobacteria bacterium]|nr:MAG: ABC transporter substrate-binding protein [Deltaproteobacteria bacterium]